MKRRDGDQNKEDMARKFHRIGNHKERKRRGGESGRIQGERYTSTTSGR